MKKFILLLTFVLVAVGEIIKYVIASSMELYESIKIIPNFLSITYVKNTGAAFSILEGNKYLLIGISVITLAFLIRFILIDKKITKYDVVSYSLLLSGIIGNLIDRIAHNGVIDYIHFKLFSYEAPIFNFSDICIVFGVLMVMYVLVIRGDNYEDIHSRK